MQWCNKVLEIYKPNMCQYPRRQHSQPLNTYSHITTQLHLAPPYRIWISILALNSPTSMRAISIRPFAQANIRAVYPHNNYTPDPIHNHALRHHRTTTSPIYIPKMKSNYRNKEYRTYITTKCNGAIKTVQYNMRKMRICNAVIHSKTDSTQKDNNIRGDDYIPNHRYHAHSH